MNDRIIPTLYFVLLIISVYTAVVRVQSGDTNAAIVSILIAGFSIWRIYGTLSQARRNGVDDD